MGLIVSKIKYKLIIKGDFGNTSQTSQMNCSFFSSPFFTWYKRPWAITAP